MASPVIKQLRKVLSPRPSLMRLKSPFKSHGPRKYPKTERTRCSSYFTLTPKELFPDESVLTIKVPKETHILALDSNINSFLERGVDEKYAFILGKGTFGTVILSRLKGKNVALKIVKNNLEHCTMTKEMNALILSHPNIVDVIQVIHNPKKSFGIVVMEAWSPLTLQAAIDDTICITFENSIRGPSRKTRKSLPNGELDLVRPPNSQISTNSELEGLTSPSEDDTDLLNLEKKGTNSNDMFHDKGSNIFNVNGSMFDLRRGYTPLRMDQTLNAAIGGVKPNLTTILMLFMGIVEALDYCHQVGIVHLDVKPKNILIDLKSMHSKLCDFGNSNNIRFTSAFPHIQGTVAYIAPELFKGKCVTEKCDVYSFGITMWQMLHKENPYRGIENHVIIYKVVANKFRPHTSYHKSEFRGFVKLYERCWQQDPSERPSIKAVGSALQSMI